MTRLFSHIIAIIMFTFISSTLFCQFYNGHQMNFGKNRIQYSDFYWSYYRYERFDVYYNEYGQELAEYTADFANNEVLRIEKILDYTLDKRIIFIVYNKLSDFRQSNIGLVTGNVDNNIGGVTTVNKNKVFLYYEGDFKKLEIQIREGITEVLINEMLYGLDLRDNVANSTLINLPDWYINGLKSYISNNWDYHIENTVKDGILTKKYKRFNKLIGEDAKYAGHSFWRYVELTYGESVISNIIYITKVHRNANKGFLYVLGLSVKDLSKDWKEYYTGLYGDEQSFEEFPEENKIIERPKKAGVYQQIKVNPNGKYFAYVTNELGRYKIWIYNINEDKHEKIFKKGNKLEQITDYSYPILAWHPSGRILTFIVEEEGGIKLYYYDRTTKELTSKNMLYFDKIIDYSFSHDGSQLVLSAVYKGKTDIFIHNIASTTNFQVTNDIADDINPRFINNSKQLIFSSNRRSDTLSAESKNTRRAMSNDLFIYDYASKSDMLMRLSNEKYINKILPIEVDHNEFISLKNTNGIINRHKSRFDSTIHFIDTTVHYKYYATTYPLTNYSRNIISHDYNRNADKIGQIIYNNGRYYMYDIPPENEPVNPDSMPVSAYKKQYIDELERKDSLQNIVINEIHIDSIQNYQIIIKEEDTIHLKKFDLDINNYIFEVEKVNYYNNQLKNHHIRIVLKDETDDKPKIRIYQTAFYQNYIVTQIDFDFLHQSYQAFTGGEVYFNPGTNVLVKLGANDLFEDYKLVLAMRIPVDLESTEYLISIENLKGKFDQQLVFHRQVYRNYTTDYELIKTKSHDLSYIIRYPVSQVRSWVFTSSLRNDRAIYLAEGPYSINERNVDKFWISIKLEHIFDNTRSLGINLREGMRYKMFGEFYNQVYNGSAFSPVFKNNLIVFGADFRHYLKIHRNLIWANRFATGASLGTNRLIYYLGGVDNWLNITRLKTPTFIPITEIPVDLSKNYAYQTVATNMRGFSQNIRNGDNFALINSEIRFPFIRYFTNYPISNSFFENLQVIGFFDVGTAWSGLTPWSKQNAYDKDIVQNGPVTITIDSDRDPFVAGYGFGLRSQIFGYFIRTDWAWGIENNKVLPHVFYLSFSLDF